MDPILNIDLVSDKPLTLILTLPDGCRPGRFEAARSFAESVGRLRDLYGDKKFQLVPFSFDDVESFEKALTSILAIEC